jgi:redox-sensing transcriptional repressor
MHIEIGIITTPPERAQRAANYLTEAGIKGLVNFAPNRIKAPEGVHVEYVDFFHNFFSVAFNITLDRAG